ncbi:hypothetical protein IMG5_179470 [Ichthyophthirius multifiliis]|uniref:Cyclic nucleotide-binding domain-containing protein n=1 Tax=Ichthyophthirius multifiliis TaxID=5932 RepID=G0R2M6_ICHMU|nr:hypothetical protein IMG5_179470 [Ichthyophthirius multifiliis]EGR28290.1 hypothetical protein IMG5_179470 [Ichthyophthirius multifiliis]|eukprot:XP_004027635.1 hypothetical protein IMG5_179470 [Ichthyophthirius multifiliis]
MAHFVACLFHYVAMIDIQNGRNDTWLHKEELLNTEYNIRYLNSYYFACITMVTVGYGDITPQTPREKLFIIMITIISCGLFGYSMNTIGTIFQEIAKRESEFKQNKYDINIYLRTRNITKRMQLQILKSMQHQNLQKSNKNKRGEEIIRELSQNIQTEFKKEFFGKILSSYNLFNLNFSIEAREKFCIQMKELILQAGDYVYLQNSNNQNIYFLYDGKVDVYQQIGNEQKKIGQANQGDVLGNYSFFSSLPEKYGAQCSSPAQFAYFNRQDLLDILKSFPKDYVFKQFNFQNILFIHISFFYNFVFKIPIKMKK